MPTYWAEDTAAVDLGHRPQLARRPGEVQIPWLEGAYDARALPFGRTDLARTRSAWFTALVSGKTAATSGSRTTMLLPSAKRAAYFPRTPRLKSYSGRMSVLALGFFFIDSTLNSRRETGADDVDGVLGLDVRHDDET